MRMRVINLVDSLARVNYGIWNAAINTAGVLGARHQIASEIWYPASTAEPDTHLPDGLTARPLASTSMAELERLIAEAGLEPGRDLIVSHGAWRYPTRWGAALRKRGFRWVYTPHGMLEPWSMEQKRLKKALYYYFIEGPKSRRAAGVRAVGRPERQNLLRQYRSVIFIPNGHSARATNFIRPQEPVQFVYLARLHHKKRPYELAQAWLSSTLAGKPGFRLIIAGPDEGEGAKIRQLLQRQPCSNLELSEPIYGLDKERLLRQSHFFLLPSLSEGFPTAVVEALSEGLIPLISTGCNFPDVLEAGLALNSGTEVATIAAVLDEAAALPQTRRYEWQNRCRQFAVSRYSLEVVARHQAFWYAALMGLHASVSSRNRPPADEALDDDLPPLPTSQPDNNE